MSRIKSNTLPHSLYRELKDEIKRRGLRVLELEASMRQLRREAATTRESLDAAEAQIASLLEEHVVRDAADEELRENYREVQSTAGYYAELNDHLKTRLRMAYTTLAVIGGVVAFTAVISAVQYLPKVL